MSEKVSRLELYIVVVALLLAMTVAVVNQSSHFSDLRDEVEDIKFVQNGGIIIKCETIGELEPGESAPLIPDSTGGR